jgi:hypothetical protein
MQFKFIAIRLQVLRTLCTMHLVQIQDIFNIWINLSIKFLKTNTTSAKLRRAPPSNALACSMATPASFASLPSCCPYKKSCYTYKYLETGVIKRHCRGIKLPSNLAKVFALAVCPHVSGFHTHPLCRRRSLRGHLQCARPSKLA